MSDSRQYAQQNQGTTGQALPEGYAEHVDKARRLTEEGDEAAPCGWCHGEGAIKDPSGKFGADCPRCKGRAWLLSQHPDHPLNDPEEKEIEANSQFARQLYTDGWQGTPPAEGTRRGLIRDVIERTFTGKVFPTDFDGCNELYLELADAVESALLQTAIGEEEVKDVRRRIAEARELDVERCDRLLEQREEARGGEDHWKGQRDAALRLLLWVIGDLLPPPAEEVVD